MSHCNIIIYSYHYLLDPKIAERVSKDLSKDSIIVFDEAHNIGAQHMNTFSFYILLINYLIDNVCIESLSLDITEESLRRATRGATNLEKKITEMKATDAEKLTNEYQKLVEGLQDIDDGRQEDSFMANPGWFRVTLSPCCVSADYFLSVLPDDLLKEAVPGNIRRAEHFVAFLKRFVEYLKVTRHSY